MDLNYSFIDAETTTITTVECTARFQSLTYKPIFEAINDTFKYISIGILSNKPTRVECQKCVDYDYHKLCISVYANVRARSTRAIRRDV